MILITQEFPILLASYLPPPPPPQHTQALIYWARVHWIVLPTYCRHNPHIKTVIIVADAHICMYISVMYMYMVDTIQAT